MTASKRPVLIELDGEAPAAPDAAPAVLDTPTQSSLQRAATIVTRRPSRLTRWFWSLLLSLIGFVASLAAWDYITALVARSPMLGGVVLVLLGLFGLVTFVIALRELAAFSRLRRVDQIQRMAAAALASDDLGASRKVTQQLGKLYDGRDDIVWDRARFDELSGEILDADGLLILAETTFLAPLDIRAMHEIEAAARQVATVTALVPLALADVFTALTANMRMIRRIAEIYGGRSGVLGSWRLVRTVLTHLVATGAVAVGDDLIGSIAGGSVLSKISRRFGEGIINGALTARVGVAAMEVCRPLPFHAARKPSVTGIIKRALTGLFGRS